ncbi:chemotaxis protein CheX [Falsibacillus pallidus]|uniref:Chemotaxis protein CheX n=1 Tax=Falsibacillus pallidus TaxID=493781 RepID=A0A370GIK6_9BACI|nr:chemotaxis protein CheX [Falsibacillus pallidus]RDI43046.1 chemotaxis protein CheX [Falsibacillus pallidus]
MTITKAVTDVLNCTIHSIKSVIPIPLQISKPSMISNAYYHDSIAVLIGMTGDIRGRIMIDGQEHVFAQIGSAMFGMPLEGEMLESFSGELGNMIAGHLSTQVFQDGFSMDITPPTVMSGNSKVSGFDKAFRLPILLQEVGELTIILMVDQNI